jgi:uncharacterized protein with PhoU and TrkA domain
MDKKVIDSLKKHSMEDLIQWRNSAHDRIKFTNEAIAKEVRTLEKEMAERANQIRKLCNYKDKTVTWYKSLGKVISSRIKGIQFSDKIFTTKI